MGPTRPAGACCSGRDNPSERNQSQTRRAEPIWIGQNVVDCGISRSDPTDGANPTSGRLLQWKGQSFGAEPEPDAARGAELGEAFEDRADGAGDSLVRIKQDFAILFSPNETDG